MKRTEIEYFSPEDVAFIPLSSKKSLIGNEEFQDDVVIYRLKDEIVGIEIQKFYGSKINKIQISKTEFLDLTEQFRRMRMIISLRDIIHDDPKQFMETMEAWGMPIIENKIKNFDPIQKIGITIPPKVQFSKSAKKEVVHCGEE